MSLLSFTSRQRRARTPVNASLKRSPAATALRCSVFRPAEELASRCALRSNSLGKLVNVRASRVAVSPGLAGRAGPEALLLARHKQSAGTVCVRARLLGALEAHCRVSAHAFAEPLLARYRWSARTRLRGRRWPAGAISEAARSADSGLARKARFVTDSPRLSERSAQHEVSSAAQPRIEHRSGVCTQCRPPKCEPPPGTG